MIRHRTVLSRATVLVAAAMLVVAVTAPTTASAGTVAVAAGELHYDATPGEVDRVFVERDPDGALAVNVTSGTLVLGADCASDPARAGTARCGTAAVLRAVLHLGDGDDMGHTGDGVAGEVYGEAGKDTISGGSSADRLDGGSGEDDISAGEGDDTILTVDGEHDSYTCEEGDDTVVSDAPIAESPAAGDSAAADEDCEHRTERFPGGVPTAVDVEAQDDARLVYVGGDAQTSTLDATASGTAISFHDPAGIYLQAGTDCTRPDPADSTRVACPLANRSRDGVDIQLGAGDDHVTIATPPPGATKDSRIPDIDGGAGDDTLRVLAGDSALVGNEGADMLLGGPGVDELDGGPGDDTIRAGDGGDFVLGGSGNDVLDGGGGIDKVDLDRTQRAGVDKLLLRDGERETAWCDGVDTAEVDAVDDVVGCRARAKVADTAPRASRGAAIIGARMLTGRSPSGRASTIAVPVSCPSTVPGSCTGTVQLGKQFAPFRIKSGKRAVVSIDTGGLINGWTAGVPVRLRGAAFLIVTRNGLGRTRTQRLPSPSVVFR